MKHPLLIWLRDILDLSAFDAGLAFLSFSLGCAIAAVGSGRLERFAPWLVMTVGLVVGALGTIGMALSESLAPWSVFAFFAGLGLGISWSYTSVVTQSLVPKEQAGAASGTVLTVLISVSAVGPAMAVSILDTHTTSGASNEAQVIDAILTGAALIVLGITPLVALFGRDHGHENAVSS